MTAESCRKNNMQAHWLADSTCQAEAPTITWKSGCMEQKVVSIHGKITPYIIQVSRRKGQGEESMASNTADEGNDTKKRWAGLPNLRRDWNHRHSPNA